MAGFSFSRKEQLYAMMGKKADCLKGLRPPDDWELVESIGEGTYGEVYKTKNKVTGEIAAAKVIDSIHEKIEEVLPELDIFKKYATHPNIADFYGAFINVDAKRNDQLWLVMELCRGGSVTNLVKSLRKKGKYLDEDLIAYILYETLKGIEHLHRHNVMHRDIKGPNVMLTKSAEIRLIDFGVSAELSNILMRRNSSVGTPFWMAPEVIACEQQLDYSYDIRCDIWSLGITAIELADGVTPLSEQHPMRALFKIPRSKPPSMKNPERWSHEYRDFIAKCLVKDFEIRPHASEMSKHIFVRWVEEKKEALRQKLMNLMDKQYQGRDGITGEIDLEEEVRKATSTSTVQKKSPVMYNSQMLKVDNLAELGSLTEDIILSHLLGRYLNNQIYTYIGDILIAINPLKTLDLYGPEQANRYRNSQKSALPPHIYMVADMTHQAMVHNKNPQCCLISGESGAGKTVSADYLVRHLAELGKAGNRTLEEKILLVNPLMEALGNAQTAINDNSSRFGKYLELHFTSNGALTGGILSEYLLEKSRVVSQSQGERNFHIFYYMIAGLAYNKKLEKYSFKLYSAHNYLQTGGRNLQDLVCTLGNRRKFEEVQRCLDIIGFSHEEVSQLFSILAAVIHLGDIYFTEDESVSHLSDKSMVSNPQLLLIVSSLLGINAVELRDALTTNSNVTRGETIVRNNSVDQAVDYRDGMAKALYGKLFSWIVYRINALLRTDQGRLTVGSDFRIGILDIFGFENFKRNSFEQLCINIANEQIQFYFNQQIFSWELEEYRTEGISVEQITFTDNREVLDMCLQKPIGLLALLDEESRFPRATDFTLIEKFNKNLEGPHYEQPKETDVYPSFAINHYAGRVKYDATNFLEKNRDTLSPDIIHVLRSSDNRLVRTLMQHPLSSTGVTGMKNRSQPPKMQLEKEKKLNGLLSLPETKRALPVATTSRWQQTVSMHFRYSLRDLLAKLLLAEPHFVRCIRPNEQMIPGKFDQDKVQTQLKYTGVLETTRIRQQGYSERITFEEFVKRYQVLVYPLHLKIPRDPSSCVQILKQCKIQNWLIGRTKVFLKYYHVEELSRLLEIYREKAVILQKVVRGWIIRRRYEKLKRERYHAATVIQKHWLGYVARKYYQRKMKTRRKAVVVIQRVVRGFLARKRFQRLIHRRQKSATKIQAVYRGYRVRRNLPSVKDKEKVKEKAAVHIQSAYRGYKHRKDVSKRKLKAQRNKTQMMFFLQEVGGASESLLRAQKGHTKVNCETDGIVIREGRTHSSEDFWSAPRHPNGSEETTTSQQQSQMVCFIHQDPLSPTQLQVLPREPHPKIPQHLPRNTESFQVRPNEVALAEIRSRDTPRRDRCHRKEIWSATDELYLNNFTDAADRIKREAKDQERRIRDMLSTVVGTSPDYNEITNTEQENERASISFSLTRNLFENREKPQGLRAVPERKRSTEWKPRSPSQESLIIPSSSLLPKPYQGRPKATEPRNQADLVRQALLAQRVTGPVKPETGTILRSNFEPSKAAPYIPPPDYKLPPEKRGYLRHVAPELKQASAVNFHVEGVHLKHLTQRSSGRTQLEQPRYSHLLRKTGRRGELGIEEEDDSDVTRISFNVPLVGVS